MSVTVDVTTNPIGVIVEDSSVVISSDETPPLPGSIGYAPDPSGQPDDKWLRTVGGTYVFTDAPSGTANPSDASPQPVGASPVAGVSTGLSRADHVHEGAAIGHNHDGAYSASGHNHDAIYLSPAEVIAGTNVAIDLATTPGSVIISAAGALEDGDTLATGFTQTTVHGDLPLMPVWSGSQAALDGLTQQAGILYLVTS